MIVVSTLVLCLGALKCLTNPFPKYFDCEYILVVVDYMSKWVEAIVLPTNDAHSVTKFLKKNSFTHFGTPQTMISDGGTHFCNKLLDSLLTKYMLLIAC